MRHAIGASTTAFLGVAVAAFCSASCGHRTAPPPPAQPPARAILVTDGRVSLRATAYVELHLWLASAARRDEAVGAELEPAKRTYARSLRDDADDRLLDRTTRALSACSDDRCSSAAVASEGFGRSYDRALPEFVARSWLPRASATWVGVEAAHAALGALGEAAEAIFARAGSDLGVRWPDHAVPVDVVSETPPLGRAAVAPVALATRGPCFVRDRDERVNQARILDCLVVHALLATRGTEYAGTLRDALVRELGPGDGERAWSLLVIHAVASIVTGWQPKHRSAYWRSAEAAEPAMLEWLGHEWRGAGASSLDAFGARFAMQWRELHSVTK